MTDIDGHLARRNILVIDDVEMNRSIVAKVFQNIYTVLTAENGAVGMQMLREHEVDLVLLDIQMPVMDGFEVLAAMKKDIQLSSIPVVVVTGEVERAEKKIFDLGADDFIEQPYDSYIMRKRVENLIERYDLKKMRDALHEQMRYRNLFDIMGIAYWEWTRSNGYYHSEKYGEYAVSEMTDELMWDENTPFSYVHPDDVTLMKQFMQKHSDDEIKKSAIVRCLMKDGSYHWTEMFSIAESASDGQLLRLVSIMRDVDKEWLEQKQQLEQALEIAKDANQSKSDFLSRVSHDMRTPLNVILSIAKLVPEERPSYEMMLSYFNSIGEEGSFLLRLINDVLDMQKMESGVIELKSEPVEFENIINQVIGQAKHLADKKQIIFTVTVQKFVDGVKAVTDPLRMQQLLNNLIANAIKYTPEHGKVELIFENLKFENNVAIDKIIVRDNGLGMSKNFMKHMYDPFTQEHGGFTSTTRGTGLGLSIVKKIVDIMGGTISCKSEPGKGTEFCLILKTPVVIVNKSKSSVENVEYADQDDFVLIGRRILLCEDHPLNAMIAEKLMRRKGLIVTHAENGQLGVDYFNRSTEGYYDAVLMDVRMPVMDGLKATRAIRALSRKDAKMVPIIAMTANAYSEDVKRCIEAGMNEHLPKPVEPQTMWDTLYHHIDFSKKIQKLKVIIVDDVEVNRVAVAESIREHYEPVLAESGSEALKFLENYSDVVAVITDIMMPEMDGQELIRTIRAKREYDNIAILANTQFGEQAKEEEILKDGADDFIYKPTTSTIVMTRLTNVMMHRNNMTRS